MSELIKYHVQNHIAVITLYNPPANAYSYEMMLQLDEAILKARMEQEVHVILLRGSGDKFFCAGADIEMLGNVTPEFKYYFCIHANETLNRLEQTSKLVVAALNGHTVGGGLEIAMAADIRIAKADGGKVGLPEVHLGVLPGTGGTQRLARLIGASKSIELMATGKNLTFQEAKDLGIINHIIPAEKFDEDAMAYAQTFTPPHKASCAVGAIKRAVQSGLQMGFQDGLALERELQQQLFKSQDAAEGISAFNEKRTPEFKGA